APLPGGTRRAGSPPEQAGCLFHPDQGQTSRPYVVVFGGPVLYPQDTALVYQRTQVMGYIGGSTVERFATEPVIRQTVHEFKQMTRPRKTLDRLGSMIGRSDAMQECFQMIRQVADSKRRY